MGSTIVTGTSSITPNRVIIILSRATCFALRLAPAADRNAGIHAPRFMPYTMYIAWSMPIAPAAPSAIRIPTEADELWMTAVMTTPNSKPTNGLLTLIRILSIKPFSLRLFNAPDIISIPKKSMPNPARI